MQIENAQVKLGLRHVASGLILILNAAMVVLMDGEMSAQQAQTGAPAPADPAEAPKKRGRKPAEPTTAAPENPPIEHPVPPTPAASGAQPTYDTLRQAIRAFISTPKSGGSDKAKALLLEHFKCEKISQVPEDQLLRALKVFADATEEVKNGLGDL